MFLNVNKPFTIWMKMLNIIFIVMIKVYTEIIYI